MVFIACLPPTFHTAGHFPCDLCLGNASLETVVANRFEVASNETEGGVKS